MANLLIALEGREINPGHDLEALWFMMNLGIRRGDKALIEKCVEIALKVIDLGWDKEYGGIFYFLDAKGAPQQKLEWDQKLSVGTYRIGDCDAQGLSADRQREMPRVVHETG